MKSYLKTLVLAAAVSMVGFNAFAADEAAAPAQQPTAEQKAMTEKMQKAMSPNENHKVLEQFVGKWTYTSKCWMEGSATPDVSTGVAENSMIYGGRFLKSDVKGTWQNQPFEGVSTTGYDNVKEKYVSTWLDSMMTGIMASEGTYDAATKTLKLEGTCSCPITGDKNMPMRTEWTVNDADTHTFSAYSPGKDGKEFKGMEIVYKRA